MEKTSDQKKEKYDVRAQEGEYEVGDSLFQHNLQGVKVSFEAVSIFEGPNEVTKRINNDDYHFRMSRIWSPK